MNVRQRIEALERRERAKGKTVVVYDYNLSPEEFQQRVAEAEAEAGPHGMVIVVEFAEQKRERRDELL